MKKLLISCYLLCWAQCFFAQTGFQKFRTCGGNLEDDAVNIIYDKINGQLSYGGQTMGNGSYGPFFIHNAGALSGVTLTGDTSFNFNALDTFPRELGRMAVDDSGYVYTPFNSYSGNFTVGGVTVNSGLTNGVYISKAAPDGTVQWVFTVGSGGSSSIIWYMNVAPNSRHELFMTFYTADNFTFSNGTVLSAVQDNHIIVCKIGSVFNPSISWVKEQGGPITGLDYPFALAADDSGNCYIAGQENSDSFKLAGFFEYNNSTTVHGFLIKMDSLGNGVWAKYAGKPGPYPSFYGEYDQLKTGPDGNLYAAGASYELQFYDTTFVNNFDDHFLIKYSPEGKVLAYAILDLSYWFSGMDIDRSGNVYLSGEDNAGTMNGIQWISPQQRDVTNNFSFFVYKFDSNLKGTWLFHDGSRMQGGIRNSVAADNSENIYYAGSFMDSCVLVSADTALHPVFNAQVPYPDVLLIKYNTRCNNPGFAITASSVNLCTIDSAILTAPAGYSKYYWYNGNTLLTGSTNRYIAYSPGSYWVGVLDTSGCMYIADTVFVTVPLVPTITGPTTNCSGTSMTLTAHGGNTYSWSNALGSNASVSVAPTYTITYRVTISDNRVCSATASQTVTVYSAGTTQVSQTTCTGVPYNFNNRLLYTQGVYYDTLQTIHGCDSIVQLLLTVTYPNSSFINATTCNGTPYVYNNHYYTQQGIYYDTLQTALGCDSLIITDLTITDTTQTNITGTTCNGTPFLFNNQNLTQSGIYYDTLQGVNGCDSLIILSLTVTNINPTNITGAICTGGSFPFNNRQLTQAGIYYDTLQSAGGCDSVVVLNLAVNNVLQTNIADSVCNGGTYIFNGRNLTQAGTYKDTLQAVFGCDSVVTLNLQVNVVATPTITRTGDTLSTQTFNSYQWLLNGTIAGGNSQSILITQNGNYSVAVTGTGGCMDTSAVFSVTGMGINEIISGYGVKLFPNPNNGSFTLQFTDNIVREVEIKDAVGRSVVTATRVSGQQSFNVEELAPGIYIMIIYENGGQRSLKFSAVK